MRLLPLAHIILCVVFVSSLILTPAIGQTAESSEQSPPGFDHDATSFPLTGAHTNVPCSACHIDGELTNTPSDCASCHNNVAAKGKSAAHPPSGNQCSTCHTASNWNAFNYDHSRIDRSCQSCHDGTTAKGKASDHLASTEDCSSCHVSTSWTNVRFDHSAVTGTCSSCHNGRTATGKPANHIPSSNTCEDCHVSTSWTNVRFDHASVTGTCSSCHNGRIATGKPRGHFVTNQQCSDCHRVTNWAVADYRHLSAAFPTGHSAGLDCIDCHRGNSAASAWSTPAYQPDCAGCHARDFRPGPHEKYENPSEVPYRVNELRDCTGACHVYTDATQSRIEERRTGEHRASRREW